MNKKTNLTITLVTIISFITWGQTKSDTLVFGLKNSKIYKESTFNDFNYSDTYTPKIIKAKLKPTYRLKFESQVGISIRPSIIGTDSYSSRLHGDLYIDDTAGNNFLQIGEYDFDKDGVSELVIAFGVRGSGLLCYIFKYHEPAKIADATRSENWELIGEFEYGYHDPKYVSNIDKNKIYFPFGSQGASDEFILVEGKFVKFQ
jgi:hypothetical protein